MAGASSSSVAAARAELRNLQGHLADNKTEATSIRSDFLGKALDKQNQIYEVVKNDARGAAIDASLLATTSMLGAEQAGNLEHQTPEKFISKLRARHGFNRAHSNQIKWAELAASIVEAGIYKLAPAATFVDGRFEAPEKKVRQKREKREREADGPAQVAESVTVDALKEEAEDKAQVKRLPALTKAIKEASRASEAAGGPKRANLFQVLLHPSSFSQTVENFFDVSFLVKHGQCRISSDANGLYLSSEKPPTTDTFNQMERRQTQNILKLDQPTYEKLVQRWCTPDKPPLLADRGARTVNADSGRRVAARVD